MPSRRWLYWLAALILLSISLTPAVLWVLRLGAYLREQRAGRELVAQPLHRDPFDILVKRSKAKR